LNVETSQSFCISSERNDALQLIVWCDNFLFEGLLIRYPAKTPVFNTIKT